ncbi:coenzyme F420-0:L-glutamate ligase/coenzyme F420-1:gamma-L-glutamate ligase [Trueperella bonasi]|uniref:Coenzyme F420-0:L-glutamate ligase/coenzyme F420-1:gamma-L-glutamate ligase n=1 Tax=Trueperella bonasi TaxID=312286 RepID=A0ABT9NHQ5_9ACTO|nr:coenzyme F420-0:L-glutamate ligase [Trueperella bonasi]MDP9806905.1 coenzyme F420-0:L-glutamate ligase/coenzyme F420-1:gamma-L-glutamate ligase [Trueperella bonasi]
MTQIQAVAVPGIPMLATGDDVAAVISSHLNTVRWPDGYVGMRGDDIVVISGKIVAKAQGRWHRLGEVPDGFRTRVGIPDGLGLKEPDDADSAAGQIRRGLAARFGGRPGVIISGSGHGREPGRGVVDIALGSAGLEVRGPNGDSVIDAIAALAGVASMGLDDSPVVVVRGVPDVMTWEDLPGH